MVNTLLTFRRRFWLVLLGGIMLQTAPPSYAQVKPKASAPAPAPAKRPPPTGGAPAATPGTLPAAKVEEALRLLLQATATPDSLQNNRLQLPEAEINGLVIDQTITKIGRDFYGLFYGQWDPPQGLGEYTVVIQEKPGRGTTTLISVTVNDNALVDLPLSPNNDAIEDAVAYSLSLTLDYLINARNVSQQLDTTADNPGTEVY
ncbi:CsgE family curli-type amyloid fiber assembly protein [Hymenobacter mucosus]|uniref:Curli production assembly/transport component CsgE n=1 Tax=Hymenobacter mucosus TaxID=1411120 RepID=A0A238ZBD3_9BACT|nr:CsgE family curli-type amyloid fiber assembly protein [Hymenobacter mucosus]SNR80231.1 Curli assembly protein CsgE [Hymenobacter mucosus]